MKRRALLLASCLLVARAMADIRVYDEGADAGIAHALDCRGFNVGCTRIGSTLRLGIDASVLLAPMAIRLEDGGLIAHFGPDGGVVLGPSATLQLSTANGAPCDMNHAGGVRYQTDGGSHGAFLQWCPGSVWHEVPTVHRITFDWDAPIVSNNNCVGTSVSAPMARVGDVCTWAVAKAVGDLKVVFDCHVGVDGTMTFDICNGFGTSPDPPDATYNLLLFHP